jgi:hypothetical protein
MLVIFSLVVACGGDDDVSGPIEVTTADLAGNWRATSIKFTSIADPSKMDDLIDEGFGATMIIDPNGCYIYTVFRDGESQSSTGTLRVVGLTLLIYAGECRPGDSFPEDAEVASGFAYTGDTFSLAGESSHDVGDNGSESAIQTLVFRRE